MMDDPEVIASEAIIDNGRFGQRTVRFETGLLAQQAAGSALAYLDDQTTVLSATTVGKNPRDQFDFFPLTVDVEERQYAAGRIPGNFFRREGRPGTEAILAARQIDRPLRPSFVKGLRNEVQVVATVLTVHPDDAYDVLAINAASMSTQISGLPFSGPIGGTRISLVDGQWVAFPRYSEIERSTFNMVVAGRVIQTADGGEDVAIMMVEAGGGEGTWELIQQGQTAPTEDVVAAGLEAAKPFIKELCRAQAQVAAKCQKETLEFPLFKDFEDEHWDAVAENCREQLDQAVQIAEKLDRQDRVDEIKDQMLADLEERFPEGEKELKAAFRALEKELIRTRTLNEGVRMDGRKPNQIRSLYARAGVLPRLHGSAIFRRGETQVLGVTTLNMLRMEQ
ncbi:MAG: polyribonucleotide nucleotidyltransferase, partial [Varibaculum cambriense]|nr:polyribonucleotide nucleotidyltransferase [Varibaculum cambriense]